MWIEQQLNPLNFRALLANEQGLIWEEKVEQFDRLSGIVSPDTVLSVALFANEDISGRRFIRVEIGTQYTLTCQRCLDPVILPVDLNLSYRWALEEADVEEDNTLEIVNEETDFWALFEDELLLAVPTVARHEVDCALPGDYEHSTKTTQTEARQSPFAELSQLTMKE